MFNDKGKQWITGYKQLGDASKDAHIKREGYMVNDKGKQCIIGYKKLGDANGKLGDNATKDALIKHEGYMVNDQGVRCITGYKKLGNASKDAHIKRKGYVVNDQGVRCSTGYKKLGKKGGAAKAKISRATAMVEHHSHISISAICQRGASMKWEEGSVRMYHHCYDPERSGLAGQKPQQVRGLGLHVCKKCHRTAKKCNEASCLAPACSNKSLMLCEHFH